MKTVAGSFFELNQEHKQLINVTQALHRVNHKKEGLHPVQDSNSTSGYKFSEVIYGHVHMAKTAGTKL